MHKLDHCSFEAKKSFLNKMRWPQYGAIFFIIALLMTSLLGSYLFSHNPNFVDLSNRLQQPSAIHWLGTDHLGRDMFVRLIDGTKISLGVVILTLGVIIFFGVVIGATSAVVGGRVDQIIMRITDIFLTFPTVVLSLFLIGVLGTGLVNVIIAIVLSHWAWYARIVRGIVLSNIHADYILVARMSGLGQVGIFLRHLLPATLAQLLVLATLDIGHIMLHISALSFLGLGVAAPTAEWGIMISDARQFIWTNPMLMFWPGFFLFMSVMAFNLLGDALRDQLDPNFRMEHGH